MLVIPMTFLGAVYYPWKNLSALPWLKVAVLINPLVYVSEGMRMSSTNGHPAHGAVGRLPRADRVHRRVPQAGINGFKKRVLS